jgi:hypothetical protein
LEVWSSEGKTSIYIDRGLWERFREYALKRNVEISRMLEDIIREEIIEDILSDVLLDLAGYEDYVVDFEPIKPREGSVSDLIRVMRDERVDSVS